MFCCRCFAGAPEEFSGLWEAIAAKHFVFIWFILALDCSCCLGPEAGLTFDSIRGAWVVSPLNDGDILEEKTGSFADRSIKSLAFD